MEKNGIPVWCQGCPRPICQDELGETLQELWQGYPEKTSEKIQKFIRGQDFCSNRIMLETAISDEVTKEIVSLGFLTNRVR